MEYVELTSYSNENNKVSRLGFYPINYADDIFYFAYIFATVLKKTLSLNNKECVLRESRLGSSKFKYNGKAARNEKINQQQVKKLKTELTSPFQMCDSVSPHI
ncbi:unnamed protein product [Rhizophagus irregularis]|nr:unnamed protein product [Rhizophagus irregularis]